jgi:mono/diheme cytochrome c family protein
LKWKTGQVAGYSNGGNMIEMIDQLYQLLEKMGYTHPIHPPLTHVPMGLVIGVFIFAWVAILFRRVILPQFAYNRILLLVLIFVFPTILFGYTDWQYFYEGTWSLPIKIKLALSGVLLILLCIALVTGRKAKAETRGTLAIYTLCFLTVSTLGYFGGQLAIEGEGKPQAATTKFLSGEKLFALNCSDCHPGGSDILKAPQLTDFNAFLAYLRNPQGEMPPFPPEKISDKQAKKVYQYIEKLREEQKGTP